MKRPIYCQYCGHEGYYCYTYDSMYCIKCNIWLEPECDCPPEEDCGFKGRTEKPSQAPKHPFDVAG